MKLVVNEAEIREAIVEYLKVKAGFTCRPEDLRPITKSEGEYEDTVTFQVGYEVDFQK